MDRKWQAGVATRDITPNHPVWLHGYAARDRASDGVLEPISLGCLALSNGERTVLVIACDMIGIHASVCQRLYDLLERAVGIGEPDILLACTHTHFAPALHEMRYASPQVGLLGPDPEFGAEFEIKLVEAAQESLRSLSPTWLETCRVPVGQVLFNRRTVRADGTVETNFRYPTDLQGIAFSPVDNELYALRIRDELGIRAVLCNFGCHPVTGGPSPTEDHYRISADYPFYLRQRITSSYASPVLFTLGGAGDAVPMDRYGKSRQRIGGILGDSILLADRAFRRDESTDLQAELVELEAEGILRPDHDHVETEYDEARAAMVGLLENSDLDAESAEYREAAQRYQLAANALFRSHLYPEDRFAIPVHFLKIGQTMLTGLPFEVLSEFSRRMKAEFPNSVLCSCTGGYQGYLPFAYEYDRGGYEATSASTHFVPGTAERLLDLVMAKMAAWSGQ